MQILKTIHDELVALRARLHDLVEPEKTIADKVHAWIDEAMATLHAFEARIKALEGQVHAISHAPSVESDVPHPPLHAADQQAADAAPAPVQAVSASIEPSSAPEGTTITVATGSGPSVIDAAPSSSEPDPK